MRAHLGMKRKLNVVTGILIAMLVTSARLPDLGAQSLDRMLAIVDGQVVTESDVEEYRVLAAYFNEADVPEDDDDVLDLVIERVLVRTQVGRFPGIRATQQQVDENLARFSVPGAVAVPLSTEVLGQASRDRIESQRYFAIRFPQEASEAEIEDYYETVWVPEARAQGSTVVGSLDEVRVLVETLVILEKMQREAAVWAATLVQRGLVEVVE
jgi:hypothetical protein